MPRIARSSVSQAKPKNARNKSKKRSLQAFSIASAQNPETQKIRKHRLGAVEDDGPRRKRQRSDDEDSEDESGPFGKRPQKIAKGRFDELDVSKGSDSEGNRWKLGVVDEDDDSDIDSEDAFGSSDEERFAGFTFRGSSSANSKKSKKSKKRPELDGDGDMDLNLEEEISDGDSEYDDSLGEDAVDLATMLDDYSAAEEEDDTAQDWRAAKKKAKKLVTTGNSNDSSSESRHDEDDTSLESNSDVDEVDDEDQLAQLRDLVTGLQPSEETEKRKPRRDDPHETRAPSTSGFVSSEKFDIRDFLASTSDLHIKKVSKQLGNIPKTPKKDPKLAASLPKRLKDKLDRVAANEKAKETLNRWVDTVKHNRRAEHLSFPLADPEAATPHGSKHLLPTNQSAPMNDLESAINNILQESGLATGKADEEEERIREFEELKTNKMPLEEVQARRAELRRARDLLFREEIRSKRVKKIKSKAYRRVHRKEREKLSALDRDAFAEDGESDVDEEDRNRADRRRAEERMGAKHRDSKWAKQMKKSGRSVWDEDAKTGVSDMAQRNEELRRRIEGKEVRNEDGSGDEPLFSSEEEDDVEDSDLDGGVAEFQSLQRQLNRVDTADDMDDNGTGQRLSSMRFMQQADASRRAQNDEDIARMKKELTAEDGSEESEEEETIGRKIFGPGQKLKMPLAQQQKLNEFEEPFGSDDEREHPPISISGLEPLETSRSKHLGSARIEPSKPNSKSKKQETANDPKGKDAALKPELLPGEKHSQPDTDGWVTVSYNNESDAEDKQALDAESLPDQAEILRRAFAGEDVELAFEEEKNAVIADEDDKIIDDTLPGWGSWVGDGLSKREKQRNTGRILRREEGIKPEARKDARLKHVIVNQKRVKKNVSYMASTLPHPFVKAAEYERSIRMPIGSEWNVKETYQESTKPRILVKPGVVIKPMRKPMV